MVIERSRRDFLKLAAASGVVLTTVRGADREHDVVADTAFGKIRGVDADSACRRADRSPGGDRAPFLRCTCPGPHKARYRLGPSPRKTC
jgi:hypothetical protein